jgi:hypothetical protein
MKSNFVYIGVYFLMFIVHFVLFRQLVGCCETVFIKYYIFLSLLFMMVLTVMSVFKNLYPEYLGFIFMGLVMIKLSMMFLIMNKLHLSQVPYYKYNFILPYLVSLTLVTLFSVRLIQKNEKNQE